jgi:O-antigen ligase
MTAFLVAMSVWFMAIPTSWSVPTARAFQIAAFCLATWEHKPMLARLSVNRTLAFVVMTSAGIALAIGLLAHGINKTTAADVFRQGYALTFVFVLTQLLRDQAFFRRFTFWFVAFAVAACAILVMLQAQEAGLSRVFDLDALRRAKYELQTTKTIGLNSLSFSVAIAGALAFGVLTWRRLSRTGLAVVSAIALWVFASFTTLVAVLMAAMFTLAIWVAVRKLKMGAWLISCLFSGLWLSVHFALAFAVEFPSLLQALNEATTGRVYSWVVALAVFAKNPVTGAGPFSWHEDLVTGVSRWTDDLARYEQITGGAYHNVLFTTLAERGVVGATVLMIVIGVLIALCVKVISSNGREMHGTPSPVVAPSIVVFATLVTLMRGLGEYSGPVAYAGAHADFVALSIVAMLLATLKHSKRRRLLTRTIQVPSFGNARLANTSPTY